MSQGTPASSYNLATRMISIMLSNSELGSSPGPPTSNSLTSILISRFLLNLQATEQKSTGMVSSIGSQVESAVFQRVIGSLGSGIEFGADIDVDGIEEAGDGAGDGWVGDMENSLSGLEHTEESAVEEAVAGN